MKDCLYKYVPIATAIKILKNKTIRFTNPKLFNDPYDSNIPIIFDGAIKLTKDFYISVLEQIKSEKLSYDINIDKTILYLEEFNGKITKKPEVQLEEFLVSLKRNIRVLCLSKNNDSLLMWGHYADAHKGVVIGFDKNCDFFKNAVDVVYSNKVPKINCDFFKDFFNYEKTIKEIKKIMLTKSLNWKYEEEKRCFYDINKMYEYYEDNFNYFDLVNELKPKKEVINMPFSNKAILAVYLGCKINVLDEYSIIQTIKKVL